jgi:hypothetical protein
LRARCNDPIPSIWIGQPAQPASPFHSPANGCARDGCGSTSRTRWWVCTAGPTGPNTHCGGGNDDGGGTQRCVASCAAAAAVAPRCDRGVAADGGITRDPAPDAPAAAAPTASPCGKFPSCAAPKSSIPSAAAITTSPGVAGKGASKLLDRAVLNLDTPPGSGPATGNPPGPGCWSA